MVHFNCYKIKKKYTALYVLSERIYEKTYRSCGIEGIDVLYNDGRNIFIAKEVAFSKLINVMYKEQSSERKQEE